MLISISYSKNHKLNSAKLIYLTLQTILTQVFKSEGLTVKDTWICLSRDGIFHVLCHLNCTILVTPCSCDLIEDMDAKPESLEIHSMLLCLYNNLISLGIKMELKDFNCSPLSIREPQDHSYKKMKKEQAQRRAGNRYPDR